MLDSPSSEAHLPTSATSIIALQQSHSLHGTTSEVDQDGNQLGPSIELHNFNTPSNLYSAPVPSVQEVSTESDSEDSLLGGTEEGRSGTTMSRGGSRLSKSPRPSRRDTPTEGNGAIITGTGTSIDSPTMNANSTVELRRKNQSIDLGSSSAQTDNLLERESFSLDHDHSSETSHSFFELSLKDQRNFMLLVLLYFLQGIPMGLASGSVPFLLKKQLSFAQIGTFSLAAYPYSMKLAWSPIVDAIWSTRFGRRKSWIVPIQACSGIMLIWLGANIDWLMVHATESLGTVTAIFFGLVFLCATQDIAVDGMYPHMGSTIASRINQFRLGIDIAIVLQPFLRLYSTNSWSHGWPVPVFYSIPRFQLKRLCQQIFPINTSRCWFTHAQRIPYILGLVIFNSDYWASYYQERGANYD